MQINKIIFRTPRLSNLNSWILKGVQNQLNKRLVFSYKYFSSRWRLDKFFFLLNPSFFEYYLDKKQLLYSCSIFLLLFTKGLCTNSTISYTKGHNSHIFILSHLPYLNIYSISVIFLKSFILFIQKGFLSELHFSVTGNTYEIDISCMSICMCMYVCVCYVVCEFFFFVLFERFLVFGIVCVFCVDGVVYTFCVWFFRVYYVFDRCLVLVFCWCFG